MANLELKNIKKSFGDAQILKGIDLDIKNGEFVVFVGPSGCGKSTLLRIVAGIDEPTEGTIQIDNKDVTDKPPIEREIAMVFQSYALYPHLSVRDNMAFALRLAKTDKTEISEKVANAAKILNIEHLLDRKPKDLSGGQRQRVAIGRAIVRKPKIFLFDEPLSNLDAALRNKMRYEFAKISEELATTIIYVTHDQIEAMTLADKIVVLNNGVISQFGSPLDLYHKPQNKFVAGFIGAPKMNFLDCEVISASKSEINLKLADEGKISIAKNGENLKAGQKMTLGIRPEHVSIAKSKGDIKAKIRFLERLGSSTFAYFDSNLSSDSIIAQLDFDFAGVTNDAVSLSFDKDHCHLFDENEIAI